jgi:hypothetical protein
VSSGRIRATTPYSSSVVISRTRTPDRNAPPAISARRTFHGGSTKRWSSVPVASSTRVGIPRRNAAGRSGTMSRSVPRRCIASPTPCGGNSSWNAAAPTSISQLARRPALCDQLATSIELCASGSDDSCDTTASRNGAGSITSARTFGSPRRSRYNCATTSCEASAASKSSTFNSPRAAHGDAALACNGASSLSGTNTPWPTVVSSLAEIAAGSGS